MSHGGITTTNVQVLASASDGLKTGAGRVLLHAMNWITVSAGGDINLRDGGASGPIRFRIPDGAGASQVATTVNFPNPVLFGAGIYVEFTGTKIAFEMTVEDMT